MNFSQSSTVLDGNITQRVRFKCDGCTTSESEGKSVIYVGKRCESSVKDGGMLAVSGVNTNAEKINRESGNDWYADIGFSVLTAGRQYKVCVDYYPSSPETNFEDTGVIFVVTGLSAVLNTTVKANQSQSLSVVCTSCDESTSGYLGERCLSEIKTGYLGAWNKKRTASQTFARQSDLVTGGFNASLFQVTVDARSLDSGLSYKLCVDNDGPKLSTGFEDVGFLIDVE